MRTVNQSGTALWSKRSGSIAPLFVLFVALATAASAQDFLSGSGPRQEARIDQRLNAPVPLHLQFRDEQGRLVQLGDYFGERPVILTLVYFNCPMLCNIVLDGLVETIANIKFDVGKEYEIVTVSFDPRDTPELAAARKAKYLRRYGRPGAEKGWHFLTGDAAPIAELTNAVGFRYFYDREIEQFAHGATIIVLTPEGKIARYFYGIDFPARDVRFGLIEASKNRIGTIGDQILLLCYHYDPGTGKYGAIAMNIVRAGGAATVLALSGVVFLMIRRERHSREGGTGDGPSRN